MKGDSYYIVTDVNFQSEHKTALSGHNFSLLL